MNQNESHTPSKVRTFLILLSGAALGIVIGIWSAKGISDAQINENWWRLKNVIHILTSGSCFMEDPLSIVNGPLDTDFRGP